MALSTSTLRPGLLVNLSIRTSGNVKYTKQVIEAEHLTEAGAEEARWETQRSIADPAEHKLSVETRSKMRSKIVAVCSDSAFGLLCPERDKDTLEAAIAEARKLADDFNANASMTQVNLYVLTGRIAPDDVEAVKAINSEVEGLLERMADGIGRLDVKAVRDAASRAKSVGEMLTAEMQARVQIAVDAAREAAKKIVKAGDQAAIEIDKSAMRKIRDMRTAFLDLDAAGEIQAPAAQGRGLDLAPAEEVAQTAAQAPAFDLGEAGEVGAPKAAPSAAIEL
jgi:hypothetical protein